MESVKVAKKGTQALQFNDPANGWTTIGTTDGTAIKFLPPMCEAHRSGGDSLGCDACHELNSNPFKGFAWNMGKVATTMGTTAAAMNAFTDVYKAALEAEKKAVRELKLHQHYSNQILSPTSTGVHAQYSGTYIRNVS